VGNTNAAQKVTGTFYNILCNSNSVFNIY